MASSTGYEMFEIYDDNNNVVDEFNNVKDANHHAQNYATTNDRVYRVKRKKVKTTFSRPTNFYPK